MPELVLATEKEYRKAEAVFRAAQGVDVVPTPADEERLAEMVRRRGARAVIVGIVRYTGPLYEALATVARDRGENVAPAALIARFGVGHEGIDKPLARRHGIIVTNTPGVLDVSVAEHALWLMGCLARHICRFDREVRGGGFAPRMGAELRGKTLAVIGFGGIGRRLAAMAHFGFGMKVLAVDSRPAQALAESEGRPLTEVLAKYGLSDYGEDLDAMLVKADIVSIHLPATSQTRQVFNRARLGRMKPGGLLVNTARGSVVDEIALYDALVSGHVGGAALDVFQEEPYQPAAADKDLRTLDKVVLTPHTGSNTREANDRMALACLENVGKFFEGQFEELSRVDPPRLDA